MSPAFSVVVEGDDPVVDSAGKLDAIALWRRGHVFAVRNDLLEPCGYRNTPFALQLDDDVRRLWAAQLQGGADRANTDSHVTLRKNGRTSWLQECIGAETLFCWKLIVAKHTERDLRLKHRVTLVGRAANPLTNQRDPCAGQPRTACFADHSHVGHRDCPRPDSHASGDPAGLHRAHVFCRQLFRETWPSRRAPVQRVL